MPALRLLVAEGSDQDVCGASGGGGIIARAIWTSIAARRMRLSIKPGQSSTRPGRWRKRQAPACWRRNRQGRESRCSSLRRGRVDLDPPLPGLEPGAANRGGGLSSKPSHWVLATHCAPDPRVFVYGEDVGGAYGNAFLLLRPLLAEFGDRIINSPLAEGGVLGVCVGAALAGQRPIGEMQFNDFVANGFNQLVNNAAKIDTAGAGRCRWSCGCPGADSATPDRITRRTPRPWFYRTPGLKIVVPSTPRTRALMAAAVRDPDPVLFYEHIALYRDPRIKQKLPDAPPTPLPLGRAALRAGDDLAVISYGAYVHVALRVAERLAADGIQASVLDLRRWLRWTRQRFSRSRATAAACSSSGGLAHGGVGESLAAIIQEEAFESLDAPVRVIGALDTPVPISPLEEFFLPSDAEVERAARLLVSY